MRVLELTRNESLELGRVIYEDLTVTVKWSRSSVSICTNAIRAFRTFIIGDRTSSIRFPAYIKSISPPYSWEGTKVFDVNFGPLGEVKLRNVPIVG